MANIESPQTYGEFYWHMQREASRMRSEDYEKTLSPMVADMVATLPDLKETPGWLKSLFKTVSEPQEPDLDNVLTRFVATIGGGMLNRVLGHEVKEFDYALLSYLQNVRIEPSVAHILKSRQQITDDYWLDRCNNAGFSELEAAFDYESKKPFPSMPELLRYARYHSDPDNPKAAAWELFDFTEKHWPLWWWLSINKFSTEQVQTIYRRGGWDLQRSLMELARIGWPATERTALLNMAYEVPNAMLLLQGDLMQGATGGQILDDIAKAGIHPEYAERYVDGVLTKPNTQDIIAWQLRIDPTLGGLENELRRTGIHADYVDVYKTLAYPIPPINDLITMAVREAFTPEIASRFGQYEGLPTEYVNAAAQKGLSKEWAERYWAAHWTLPSVQQGFAMLHRGIIGEADLGLLMRALDIMPFWRDKLIQLSFKPLTRVDVRRMHLLGTLDESGVKRAYLDVGYNDRNAGLMTDFTVRYNRRSLAGFTQRDAVNAYINRFIEAGQCTSILRDIGTKGTEIPNIMRLAGYKREWKSKDEAIDAIRNRYTKGLRDLAQTRSALSQLNLASDYVSTLLAQWEPKAEAERVATFTNAQTLKLFGMGLIDEARAIEELQLLGYDDERRDLLIKSVKGQTG